MDLLRFDLAQQCPKSDILYRSKTLILNSAIKTMIKNVKHINFKVKVLVHVWKKVLKCPSMRIISKQTSYCNEQTVHRRVLSHG